MSDKQQQQSHKAGARGDFDFMDYWRVLKGYPMYRAYLFSHLCQHMGDWFVRIASIILVQEFSSSGTALANLALSKLLPQAIFSQLGGLVADRFDRRNCMILLDLLSGFVALGYLLAIQYKSLPILYVVSMLRSSLGAIYYPVTTGIVPLLVTDVHDLQLAVTLNSAAWGLSSIFGGLFAGVLATVVGLSACYVIDFVTYVLSALFIYWKVTGNFRVTSHHDKGPSHGKNVCSYLWHCGFGLMVCLKGSASFLWGIVDVVNPQFATVYTEEGEVDEKVTSIHMGMLFSVIGTGCTIGPYLINFITDARRPHTMQRACLIGLGFLTGGWLAISRAQSFSMFLFFTLFRCMGSGTVWANSTVLLQTLSEKQLLGRVLGMEFTMTTLLEAGTASLAGFLYDEAGLSKNEIAFWGACLGVLVCLFWAVYYSLGLGAAHPRFNTTTPDETIMSQAQPLSEEKIDYNELLREFRNSDKAGGIELK